MARFRLQALRTCWEVAGAQQALSGADEILPPLHWSPFFEASETAAECQGEHCLTTFNVRLLSVGSHTSFSLPRGRTYSSPKLCGFILDFNYFVISNSNSA